MIFRTLDFSIFNVFFQDEKESAGHEFSTYAVAVDVSFAQLCKRSSRQTAI